MLRVDLSGGGVDEIALNEKRVATTDDVNREILSDCEATIQPKEPLENMIYETVEGDCIETIVPGTSKEILAVA